MQLMEVMQAAFYGLISLSALMLVRTLSELKKSVEVLNVSIAVVIEKIGNHEKRLDGHDQQFRNVQFKEE